MSTLSEEVKNRLNISKEKSKLVSELMKIPKKDKIKNIPHHESYKKDAVHQMDLLFLPSDNQYKYALTVIDVFDRTADAEPLRQKTASSVVKALVKIYSRNYLSIPKMWIQVDDGSEFKGEMNEFAKKHKIGIRRALPNRHRQQASVEALNGILAKIIFELQAIEEVSTNKVNKKWVKNLPIIIEEYNKKLSNSVKTKKKSNHATCQGDSCNLLNEGDYVRRILDYAIDNATGKKIDSKFRGTDARWSKELYKIENVILAPGQPPLYKLEGINTNYTKNQLQLIKNKKIEDNLKMDKKNAPSESEKHEISENNQDEQEKSDSKSISEEKKFIGTTPIKSRKKFAKK